MFIIIYFILVTFGFWILEFLKITTSNLDKCPGSPGILNYSHLIGVVSGVLILFFLVRSSKCYSLLWISIGCFLLGISCILTMVPDFLQEIKSDPISVGNETFNSSSSDLSADTDQNYSCVMVITGQYLTGFAMTLITLLGIIYIDDEKGRRTLTLSIGLSVFAMYHMTGLIKSLYIQNYSLSVSERKIGLGLMGLVSFILTFILLCLLSKGQRQLLLSKQKKNNIYHNVIKSQEQEEEEDQNEQMIEEVEIDNFKSQLLSLIRTNILLFTLVSDFSMELHNSEILKLMKSYSDKLIVLSNSTIENQKESQPLEEIFNVDQFLGQNQGHILQLSTMLASLFVLFLLSKVKPKARSVVTLNIITITLIMLGSVVLRKFNCLSMSFDIEQTETLESSISDSNPSCQYEMILVIVSLFSLVILSTLYKIGNLLITLRCVPESSKLLSLLFFEICHIIAIIFRTFELSEYLLVNPITLVQGYVIISFIINIILWYIIKPLHLYNHSTRNHNHHRADGSVDVTDNDDEANDVIEDIELNRTIMKKQRDSIDVTKFKMKNKTKRFSLDYRKKSSAICEESAVYP